MITKNKYLPLLFITIIMIYSLLNNYNAKYINTIYQYNFYKQFIFYIIGYILLFFIIKTKKKYIYKFHYLYYCISVILLILVLIVGKEVNGAKAWFDLYIISFQPSELMKISLAITLSCITNKFNNSLVKNDFKYIFKISLLTLIPSFLVFIEPDTGAVIFFIIIYLTAFFNAYIKNIWKKTLIILTIVITSITIYTYLYNPEILTNLIGPNIFYRIDRITNYKDNYQINNALIIMGSSDFFGANHQSVILHLPEAHTDFMFAYNFYNYGLFGCLIVTISYLFLCISILLQTKKEKKSIFKKMFISTLFFSIFYNILMNINILPIMGIPLPFLSYGGSSLLINFLFLGIYFKDF